MPEVKCYFDASLGVTIHRYPVELGCDHICQCKRSKTNTDAHRSSFATVGRREKHAGQEIR